MEHIPHNDDSKAWDIIAKLGDIAGKFNIYTEEAERIALVADDEKEFVEIWENDDWWTNANNS